MNAVYDEKRVVAGYRDDSHRNLCCKHDISRLHAVVVSKSCTVKLALCCNIHTTLFNHWILVGPQVCIVSLRA